QPGKIGGIGVGEESAWAGHERFTRLAGDGAQELKRRSQGGRHQAGRGRAVEEGYEAGTVVDAALEDLDGFTRQLRRADEDEDVRGLKDAPVGIGAVAADEREAGHSLR